MHGWSWDHGGAWWWQRPKGLHSWRCPIHAWCTWDLAHSKVRPLPYVAPSVLPPRRAGVSRAIPLDLSRGPFALLHQRLLVNQQLACFLVRLQLWWLLCVYLFQGNNSVLQNRFPGGYRSTFGRTSFTGVTRNVLFQKRLQLFLFSQALSHFALWHHPLNLIFWRSRCRVLTHISACGLFVNNNNLKRGFAVCTVCWTVLGIFCMLSHCILPFLGSDESGDRYPQMEEVTIIPWFAGVLEGWGAPWTIEAAILGQLAWLGWWWGVG